MELHVELYATKQTEVAILERTFNLQGVWIMSRMCPTISC